VSISIASRKAKSRSLQNKIVEELLKKYPQLDSNDIKPAIMGESGIDIKLSNEARKLLPFGIECKNQESLSIWSAIKQCEKNASKEKLTPILTFKRNHTKTYVVMELETFIKLL
jgi:hypothetical protein